MHFLRFSLLSKKLFFLINKTSCPLKNETLFSTDLFSCANNAGFITSAAHAPTAHIIKRQFLVILKIKKCYFFLRTSSYFFAPDGSAGRTSSRSEPQP
jgi:hypothetical protein